MAHLVQIVAAGLIGPKKQPLVRQHKKSGPQHRQQREIVLRILNKAQQMVNVVDFLPLPETDSAGRFKRDTAVAQSLLHFQQLIAAAQQDGHVAVFQRAFHLLPLPLVACLPFRDQSLDLPRHIFRLPLRFIQHRHFHVPLSGQVAPGFKRMVAHPVRIGFLFG